MLLCRVSFWFCQEIGFGLHTHVLRVQYSCGVVLVFWLWREIVFGVTYILSVQYSCAVFVVMAGKLLSVQCTVVLLCQFFGCSGK